MSTILLAKNIQELIYQLNINSGLQVVGGCSLIQPIPEKFISTFNNPELTTIERHERYIDIGAGATISDILELGQNHLPYIFYEALNSIATPIIRNTATIGGNICAEGHKHTLFAPLMALDAKLEFQNSQGIETIPIQNFKKVPEKSVLTRIRVPIITPEVSVFRRLGPEHSITPQSASFAFAADTENNNLNYVRIAFAGPFTFRSKSFENTLIGYRLPLVLKDIDYIQDKIEAEFKIAATDQMLSETVKQQFLNLVRFSFEQLM